MLMNTLRSALANLFKNKVLSLINILGLSVGLAACNLIALYIQQETSYDRHWEYADRLYRITGSIDRTGGNPETVGVNSLRLMPALKQYFQQDIAYGSQVIRRTADFLTDSLQVREALVHVELDFVHMFALDVLAGDLRITLEDPGSIALSAPLAQRLFGQEAAVGRVLTIASGEDRTELRVTAVYRQPEGNTVLDLPALRAREALEMFSAWLGPLVSQDVVRLKEGVDPESINLRFPDFVDQFVDISLLQAGEDVRPRERVNYALQKLAEVYLNSPFEGSENRGNQTAVIAFSAIAALVLMIGCINFTILSAAKAAQRANEIAMRKVIGASPTQLALQFFGELLLVIIPAMLLALILTEWLLPYLETLTGKAQEVAYAAPETWLAQIVLLVVVCLIGGAYPATVLSHCRPGAFIKANKSVEADGAVKLRNVLVVFQFSVSICLIVAVAVIHVQMEYALQRDPGFNRENLLVVGDLSTANMQAKQSFKEQVSRLPAVRSASLSGHLPMQSAGSAIVPMGFALASDPEARPQLTTMSIDADFFETYEVHFLAGRGFEDGRDRPTALFTAEAGGSTSAGSLIINESAARRLGFASAADALGASLSSPGFNQGLHSFTIIGVVEDLQFASLRSPPRPEAYVLLPQEPYLLSVLTVRFEGPVTPVLQEIEALSRRR